MSGVGEAGLILGLISSAIAIFEAAHELYEAANDTQGLPKKFRIAAEQIPLIHHALNLADANIRAQNIGENDLERARPILERCKENAARVKDIFDKTIPAPNASSAERLKKAMSIIAKAKKVKDEIEDTVKGLELLAQYQIFQDADALQNIQKAVEQLSNLPDEENQPQFASYDDSVIYANTGSGEQHTYNNTSAGQQYNAKSMVFGQSQVSDQINNIHHLIYQAHSSPTTKDFYNLGISDRAITWNQTDEERFMNTLQSWTDDHVRGTFSEPMKETCTWILNREEYKKWMSDDGSNMIFVTGASGCGKSYIAKFMGNHLRSTGTSMIVEFYCRNLQTSDAEPPLLNYLIYQLLIEDRRNFLHVFPKYGSRLAQLKKLSAVTLQSILSDILKDRLSRPKARGLVVLIDGLDECASEHAKRILQPFDSVITDTSTKAGHRSIRVIIMSQITQLVTGIASKHIHLQITPDDTRLDMRSFVHENMDRIAHQRGYPIGLQVLVEECICALAQGYFLWATFVLADLENTARDISLDTIWNTLRNCLPGQSDHYETTLRRMRLGVGDLEFKLIVIMIGLRKFLTLPALESALSLTTSLQPHELDLRGKIFASCSKLLRIDQNDVVVLVHPSLQRYLTMSVPKEDNLLPIRAICSNEQELNLSMTRICLGYLTQSALRVELEALGECRNNDDEQRLHQKFPFLAYAAENWQHHLRQVGPIPLAVMDLIKSFFSRVDTEDKVDLYKHYSTFEHIQWFLTRAQPVSVLFYSARYDLENVLKVCTLIEHSSLLRHIAKQCSNMLPKWLKISWPLSGSEDYKASVSGDLQIPSAIVIHKGINICNDLGMTPLHIAASYNSSAALEVLLGLPGAQVDLRAPRWRNSTPLHGATGIGSIVVLLKNGADPNAKDSNGQTIMHRMINQVDTEILDVAALILVQFDARLDVLDRDGHRPLCYALDMDDIADEVILILADDLKGDRCAKSNCSVFRWAASLGRYNILEKLLSCDTGQNINEKDEHNLNVLQYAILMERIEAAELLLRYGAKADLTGQFMLTGPEITPLEFAVSQNMPSLVKILLKANATVNIITSQGSTLLTLAVRCESLDILDALLEAGADPNIRDQTDAEQTPLFHASHADYDSQIVEMLLLAGAKIWPDHPTNILNPLHMAAYHGNKEAMSLLIEHSSLAEINVHNESHSSPLYLACKGAHIEVIELLLAAGACIVQHQDKLDSVMNAVNTLNRDIFRILLRHGADPTGGAEKKWSPFHTVAALGDLSLFLQLAGTTPIADVCAMQSEQGWTPLLVACKNGHTAMVRSLIGLGADLTRKAAGGFSIVHMACHSGDVELVRYIDDICEGICNIRDVTDDGKTTLYLACASNHLEMVQYLINNKVDPNQSTYAGEYCLCEAAGHGNAEICTVLLESGADINAMHSDGSNALHAAAGCQNTFKIHETVLVLLQYDIHITTATSENGHTALFSLLQNPKASQETLDLLLTRPGINLLHRAKNGHTALHFALSHNFYARAAQIAARAFTYRGKDSDILLTELLQVRDGWGRTAHDILYSQYICAAEQTVRDAWKDQHALMEVSMSDTIIRWIDEAMGKTAPNDIFNKLGRAMVCFGDENEASFWCRRAISYESGKLVHPVLCNNCYESITNNRYLCRLCEDIDLCEDCLWQVIQGQFNAQHCRCHSFYKISTADISSGDEPLAWSEMDLQPRLEALAEKYRLLRKVMVARTEVHDNDLKDPDHDATMLRRSIFAGMNLPLKLQLSKFWPQRRYYQSSDIE